MLTEHRWIAKALAQKALVALGMLGTYHRAQRIGGRLRNFHPADRMQYAGKLAADIGAQRIKDATVVEIGTGWVPVVPIGLHLLGARKIMTYDLSRHLQPEMAVKACEDLPDCLEDLALRANTHISGIRALAKSLRGTSSWDDLADRMNLSYHAPTDFCRSGIADRSVDVVYSNLVLEHVTPKALHDILVESHRILKPGGICWHNVDFTDHYSHTFTNLSPVNFLRYSDSFWDAIGQNDILCQNRMRQSDYVREFERAGFEIQRRHEHCLPIKKMIDIVLDDRFAEYDPHDIACLSSRFIMRKF